MNTILVIHHSADLDGICSREVARKALGTTADYLGWDYGQPIPDLAPYATVYLIDISLPRDVMAANAAKLIWIDHHRTAIEAMADLTIRGYRIDGVAACRLAWQWFHSDLAHPSALDYWFDAPPKEAFVNRAVREPYAVRLLGEYDIWCKTDPNTDPFQLGMQAEKTPAWDVLLWASAGDHRSDAVNAQTQHDYIERITERGRGIADYTTVTNAQIITERGFDVTFEGLRFRALCTARCNSMTFLAALKPEHDGCLAYHWNGRAWRFSLYHAPGKEHHNLSKIASKYGGGGHPGACGFELAVLPVELGGSVPIYHGGAQG